METRRLSEGVDLRILREDKFKTNTLSIFFHIPLKRETVSKAALLPSVLKRGCKKFQNTKTIARHLSNLYSTTLSAGIRAKGDGEVVYFSLNYIADEFIEENLTNDVLDFIKEFLFNPLIKEGGFLPEYVESEKINLENTILSLINDKKDYADAKCRENMFGRDGYGMLETGYIEDLANITPQNLYEFYLDLINNTKVDIFLGGNISEENIMSATEILSGLVTERKGGYIDVEVAKATRKEPQYITEEINAVQSKLSIGLCCETDPVSDEYYALMLGNCIFGGSPVSKLFLNVREKLSLAYYAGSRTDRLKSVMLISSGIETKNYQVALDEILAQLKKMQNGDVTDAELEAAKKYYANGLPALKDSMRTIEDYYLSQAILGQEQSIDQLLEKLMAVTIPEIQAVMQKVTLDTVYFLKGTALSEKEAE